jgi:hypothetical protein
MTNPEIVAAAFEPDTPELHADFGDAYLEAHLTDVPKGGTEAARRVEGILQRKYPRLSITVESGPHWIVVTNQR